MGFFDRIRAVLTGRAEPEAVIEDSPAVGRERIVTEVPTSAPGRYRTHTVLEGETLAAIAERRDVDAAEMAGLNGLEDPSLIFPGQVLRLPHG